MTYLVVTLRELFPFSITLLLLLMDHAYITKGSGSPVFNYMNNLQGEI